MPVRKPKAPPRITWATLAPAPVDTLRGLIKSEEHLTVIPGTGRFNAVTDFRPGSEGLDHEFAIRFSRAIPGEFYLLRLDEELELAAVYQNGRQIRELGDNPWTVARSLGCPLPGEPPPPVVTRSDCLVEGRTPHEVAQALGIPAIPATGPLHIEPCPLGTLFYSDAGNVAVFQHQVSEKLKALTYLVATRDGGREFYCAAVENGKNVGVFETPVVRSPSAVPLDSIKGERDAAAIANALGIPAQLVDLKA
jgi:hypothetical protein